MHSFVTVIEAEHDMTVLPNCIYLAPGDFHMEIKGARTEQIISLNQRPKINFCRPSVDPMFESIVKIFGANTLALILTGMGNDGQKGAELIVKAKGTVIAQDFATSVVWGMPGAVATAGLCSHVMPVGNIASEINNIVTGVN